MPLRTLMIAVVLLAAAPSLGQTLLDPVEATDAISREFTIFNDQFEIGLEVTDAISREFTVFNDQLEVGLEVTDAVSREFTVFNDQLDAAVEVTDAISREFTVLNGVGIVQQPSSRVVALGQMCILRVQACGLAGMSYQWRKDGVNLGDGGYVCGAATPVLVLTRASLPDAGSYDVVVTTGSLSVTSEAATVTVLSIAGQPNDVIAEPGDVAELTVDVAASGPLGYQWRKDGQDLADDGRICGATTCALAIDPADPADGGVYDVVVTCGSMVLVSQPAVLSVSWIRQQPVSQRVSQGGTARFIVGVSEGAQPTCQWYRNGVALTNKGHVSGCTTTELVIQPVDSTDVGNYHVVVKAGGLPISSEVVTLSLSYISQQPQDSTVGEGEAATFAVVGAAGLPLTYRWYHDGAKMNDGGNVSGATSPTLRIDSAGLADAGRYEVVVSYYYMNETSRTATLAVVASREGYDWLAGGLGNGLTSPVTSLFVHDGQPVAGGSPQSGEQAWGVTGWTGAGWQGLGTGTDHLVRCLVTYSGQLLAGGVFSSAGGMASGRIARWDGAAWQPLGSGIDGDSVETMVEYAGDLVAAGLFNTANGIACTGIARWDGEDWHALGEISYRGGQPEIRALAVHEGMLIAGGFFDAADGGACNHIACWDGVQWRSLGGGADGAVLSLAVYNGWLHAGGSFQKAGNTICDGIARWDGVAWQPVGGGLQRGPGIAGVARCLAVCNGILAVGGEFCAAGSVGCANIARWDGLNWQPFGTGVDGPVCSLVACNTQLLVAGLFGDAGGKPSPYLARWGQPADIDGDGHVDVVDLLYFVEAFGAMAGDAAYNLGCDFNADEWIDVVDLLTLVENFGT